MNDILPFLLHHFILTTAFVILLAAVIYVETTGAAKGSKKVSVQEAIRLMNRENALVVDLRDKAAYNAGHIAGAINLAATDLKGNKKLAGKTEQAIILVCANSTTSPTSATALAKEGFTKVSYLAGGIAAWKADNLPLKSEKK